jgi:hypothetical protein
LSKSWKSFIQAGNPFVQTGDFFVQFRNFFSRAGKSFPRANRSFPRVGDSPRLTGESFIFIPINIYNRNNSKYKKMETIPSKDVDFKTLQEKISTTANEKRAEVINKLIMNRMLNKENKKTLCLCASVSLCLHNREDKAKSVEKTNFLKFVKTMKTNFVENNKISIHPLKPLLPMEI